MWPPREVWGQLSLAMTQQVKCKVSDLSKGDSPGDSVPWDSPTIPFPAQELLCPFLTHLGQLPFAREGTGGRTPQTGTAGRAEGTVLPVPLDGQGLSQPSHRAAPGG